MSGKLSPASVGQRPAVVTPPATGDLGQDVLAVLRETGWPLCLDELVCRVDGHAAAVWNAVLRAVTELERQGAVTRSTPPQERSVVALS